METRKGAGIRIASRPVQIFAVSYFPFSILLLTAGCGAPGDPVPPSPPVPVAVRDLTVHQAGDGVQLSFTLPANSISGKNCPHAPPLIRTLLRCACFPCRLRLLRWRLESPSRRWN